MNKILLLCSLNVGCTLTNSNLNAETAPVCLWTNLQIVRLADAYVSHRDQAVLHAVHAVSPIYDDSVVAIPSCANGPASRHP